MLSIRNGKEVEAVIHTIIRDIGGDREHWLQVDKSKNEFIHLFTHEKFL